MRESGILLPVSSLPSEYGIGTFSSHACKWIDWLKEAGQKYWQILPLGPAGYGDSPYQSFSTFAGNPYYIDLVQLVEQGLLTKEECDACEFGKNPDEVDYGALYASRLGLLRKAYGRAGVGQDREFARFCEKNSAWLKDYAIFMAVKDRFGGAPWTEWAEDIRLRWGNAMDYYQRELYFDIEFYEYLQYLFEKQWMALKQYANDQGIQIIGDIPIYVSLDSADVWANPALFQLDGQNLPVAVAGCPPDGFSADGQLWGNPLYRWDYHRQTGYDWWIRRIAHCARIYDVVRIDHFRGFDQYYSIPYGSDTAAGGHWEDGPGLEFFRQVEERLGRQRIIAEDLGFVTDRVKKLVQETGYPGMKVLQFAFDSREESDYLPYTYGRNTVAYTGTHDNETIVGWYQNLSDEDRQMSLTYMGNGRTPKTQLHWDFIRMAMMSVADLCIIPVQDYLGLDNRARINKPSTLGCNWKWRMGEAALKPELAKTIRRITEISGRL